MTIKGPLRMLAVAVLAVLTLGPPRADAGRPAPAATVDLLLDLDARPFAIAHRGFGDNEGEDATRPIENTIPAVRRGYLAGASVVEVDVQLTRDGEVAVYHDDFLSDLTCLNSLTMAELEASLPYVPSLQAVLNQARKFNQSTSPLSGLVIVELKAAAPLCDRNDTEEGAIVAAVVDVVKRMGMTRQVMLTSFSPTLLLLAGEHAPEIARILTISGLQFLSRDAAQVAFGLPVTLIDKKLNVALPDGETLQWAEIGLLYRLPGYASVDQLLATAFAISARVVEADLLLLDPEHPDSASALVAALHSFGLKVFGWTVTRPSEWFFLQDIGVDGIYVNDVPFGVAHEAPIP